MPLSCIIICPQIAGAAAQLEAIMWCRPTVRTVMWICGVVSWYICTTSLGKTCPEPILAPSATAITKQTKQPPTTKDHSYASDIRDHKPPTTLCHNLNKQEEATRKHTVIDYSFNKTRSHQPTAINHKFNQQEDEVRIPTNLDYSYSCKNRMISHQLKIPLIISMQRINQ